MQTRQVHPDRQSGIEMTERGGEGREGGGCVMGTERFRWVLRQLWKRVVVKVAPVVNVLKATGLHT